MVDTPEIGPGGKKAGRVRYRRWMHVYEVRPRKDHRGIDLISDWMVTGEA
jgi:hypothetical protein